MTKKIAVVLAGCGVYDGSEIHEAVTTLLAIDRQGASYQCFAPDVEQHHVINHLAGEEQKEKRNVLIEAARIARGNIKPLSEYNVNEFDALVIPGGFGVAKNLCTFAFDGPDCTINPTIEQVIKDTHQAKKPIGALCITPALITKVLSSVEVTIGKDADTAAAIEKMGGKHIPKEFTEIAVDEANRLVTTPCYMLDASIAQVAQGAENLVKKVLSMIN